MFAILLALAGVFTVTRVLAPKPAGSGGTPGLVVGTQAPPEGYEVVCPTEISPGNYGEWATPCDVQAYSGPLPPQPWGGSCSGVDAGGQNSTICRILPDGTPLYEYAIDGIAYADRSPGVYQTYFAGVPLDFPPKTETGMPGWSSVGGGKPVWQKGVAATDISQSPAPYAWHKKSDLSSGFLNPATGTGYSEVEVDCEWEYDSNPYGSGSSCHGGKKSVPPKIGPYYRPVQGIPYVPKPFKLGDLVSFVNDVKKWSCNALSSGLTVSSGILKSDVAGGVPSSVKETAEGAQAVATGFYNKVCGA